jgi:hypothetical protein
LGDIPYGIFNLVPVNEEGDSYQYIIDLRLEYFKVNKDLDFKEWPIAIHKGVKRADKRNLKFRKVNLKLPLILLLKYKAVLTKT